MIRINRKSVMIALLFAFIIVLTGCGGGEKESSTDTNTDDSATTDNQGTNDGIIINAGSDKDSDYVIGFSNGYFGTTWRAQHVDAIEKLGEEYKEQGLIKELIVQNSDGVSEQASVIESFINKKVDAIIIAPVSSSALAPVVAKAQAEGILVVDVSEPGEYEGVINIIGDNYSFMKVATQWLAEKLDGKGDVVYIHGIPGNAADEIRNVAADDVLTDYPDINILATERGDWSNTVANQAMSSLLATFDDLDGVLTQDVMARGILQAYKAANKTPPPVIGDYSFGFLKEWAEMPELESMSSTYAPGISANALGITLYLLQGYELDPAVLSPNPLNPDLIDTILAPMPFVVVKDEKELESDSNWKKELDPLTQVITLEQALEMGEGKSDDEALDSIWTDEEIASFFLEK